MNERMNEAYVIEHRRISKMAGTGQEELPFPSLDCGHCYTENQMVKNFLFLCFYFSSTGNWIQSLTHNSKNSTIALTHVFLISFKAKGII